MAGVASKAKLVGVKLRGCDGVEVPANRNLFAARSAVFQALLCSKFSEASSSVVEVGFDGWILKAISEYIYSDETPSIFVNDDATFVLPRDLAAKFCAFHDAASYFDIEGLAKYIEKNFDQACETTPDLPLAILDEIRTQEGVDSPSSERFKALAWNFLRRDPSKIPCAKIIPSLDVSTVEELLLDNRMDWNDEFERFHLIQQWMHSKDNNTEAAGLFFGLIKLVRLELIEAKQLMSTISTSVLVTSDQLADGYKKKALVLDCYGAARQSKFDLASALVKEESFMSNAAWKGRRPNIRAILVDWLMQIHRKIPRFSPGVLFLAIGILDHFLAHNTTNLEHLQLVGVTAFLMASKCEKRTYPIDVKWAVYLCNKLYVKRQVLAMEFTMLEKLGYELSHLHSHGFFSGFLAEAKARGNDMFDYDSPSPLHDRAVNVVEMLLDSTLLNVDLLEYPPSKLAAAAIAVTRRALGKTTWRKHDLQRITGYSEESLLPVASAIIESCSAALQDPKLKNLSKKWSIRRHGLQPARMIELVPF